MKLQVTKQKVFVFLLITVFLTSFGFQGFSYAQTPADVLIFTGAVWWISHTDAITEAETTKNLLQAAGIHAEITEDEDNVKEWMLQTTSNDSVNVLILYGIIPTTIYPAGNTLPDGSVAENWIETTDGNTILNHADYFGWSSTSTTNVDGQLYYIGNFYGTLRNLMDNPDIFIPIDGSVDNLQMIVTSDGSALTPSLINFGSDRPIPLNQLQGDWFAEKVLASNTGTVHANYADPLVLRDGDRGRIAIVHQTSFEDNPKGEVAAEIIINYLLNATVEKTAPPIREEPLEVEVLLSVTTTVPLTEANLHESVIKLTLSGGQFTDRDWDIERALTISGIEGISTDSWVFFDRVSTTEVNIPLKFEGNIDTDATLTFTVKAEAIVDYNGHALTATLPVTALEESLEAAPAESPLTEATLNGSTIILTLTGRYFADEWNISRALSVSGIEGVTIDSSDVERVSGRVVIVPLEFAGNIDTDVTLTLTVEPDAIMGGYDKPFTFQIPVTAVEESLDASTETPLTEATLHGSIITLTLTGRQFVDRSWYIEHALSISGIDGVTIDDVGRVSGTEVNVLLEFVGNIDTNAVLTLTVSANAIGGGYDKPFTFQIPVTAVEESLDASTEPPLTEATLHGSIITLTLTGRHFVAWSWYIENALSISGIDGVTIDDVGRVSDTEAIVSLGFTGNMDTDATLTLTVGPDAIIGGYDKPFTFQIPVSAIEETLDASTETPLTEATLHGSIITLTLTGRHFTRWESDIAAAVSVSGIEGVIVREWNVERVSDTQATLGLTFFGNIDEDTTLTLTVGPDATGYDKPFTVQLPVTAVEESLDASTETPLSEATLHGIIITLTLTGRQFNDGYDIEQALSVTGIEGVTVGRYTVRRLNDTKATVELTFSGNIDEDATLTLTVGPEAINYDKPFTFQFPVTAVVESLVISSEYPLNEATLNGSIITLTLTGRQFVDSYYIRDALSVSGIDGAGIGYVNRVSDTKAGVRLTFSGNMDTDATLTFTVGAEAIVGYNQEFITQFPVTAIQKSNATVSISPSPVVVPAVGDQLTFNLKITGGENVAGYQATVSYDRAALSLKEATNGDYLPGDTFFLSHGSWLTANALAGAANGDGTLATLTFEVLDFKTSTLRLSKIYLVDVDGKRWEVATVAEAFNCRCLLLKA